MKLSLLECLFPRGCLLCGLPFEPGEGGDGLCRACEESLPMIGGDVCRICGRPLISEQGTCLKCRNSVFSFQRNQSALLYAESGRALVRAYKFSQERHLAPLIIRLLTSLPDMVEKIDYIVPVPPSAEKRKKRGWDPVLSMARGLASDDRPLLEILGKKKGKDQKSLNFEGRMANIRGRFFLKRKPPEGRNILLVDDVFTTGATLSECARLLKENGAAIIRTVTLALDP